jgi:hypothetical protein
MTTLVKTTLDGRKVEIIGQAVMLAGKLEAMELIPIKDHPNRFNILSVMPDAAYMAGRIALTEEEAKIALDALAKGQEAFLASPQAIEERFRAAARRREVELGIE